MTPAAPSSDRLPEGRRRIRVVSIPPAGDSYVDAVLPDDADPVGPMADPSPWLDPLYVVEHAADADVVHLHDGLASLPVPGLVEWCETLRRTGVPLVATVHQLDPPDLSSGARTRAELAEVMATAEVVFTLTPGAAEDIADRFGRTPIVVAHPTVAVPDPGLGAERGLVGVRVGPPGPAVPDPEGVVRAALSGAVSGGGRLRVLLDRGTDPRRDEPGIPAMSQAGQLELLEDRPEDRGAAVQQLHVLVLPEVRGTHSRELEICRDVGTRVVAPSCGRYAEQWSDVVTYGNDEDGGLDAMSLTGAVSAALARPMPRPADQAWRAEQRAAVRRVHAEVYAQLAADSVGA